MTETYSMTRFCSFHHIGSCHNRSFRNGAYLPARMSSSNQNMLCCWLLVTHHLLIMHLIQTPCFLDVVFCCLSGEFLAEHQAAFESHQQNHNNNAAVSGRIQEFRLTDCRGKSFGSHHQLLEKIKM